MSPNPGFLIAVSLLVLSTAVLGSIGASMVRAGLSLKPILFVAVFLGMIVVPGLLFFTMQTFWPTSAPIESSINEAAEADYGTQDLSALGSALSGGERFDNPHLLFGSDIEVSLLRDAKTIYGAAFSQAEVAQMAFLSSGETVAVARFSDPESARKAGAALRAILGIGDRITDGDFSGYWGRRPNAYSTEGDALLQQTVGPAVFLWSAPSREAVLARRGKALFSALAPVSTSPTPAAVATTATINAPAWVHFFRQTSTHAVLTILLVIAASFWFFRGSAWAARIDAQNTVAMSAPELESRLLALTRNGKLEAEFRSETIQAKFTRHAQFILEPHSHTVRVLEIERMQGKGAEVSRSTRSGVLFYQKAADQADDPMTPYRDLVSQAGWAWQPDVWQLQSWPLPAWLKGLLG